jgi:hypothetical protein
MPLAKRGVFSSFRSFLPTTYSWEYRIRDVAMVKEDFPRSPEVLPGRLDRSFYINLEVTGTYNGRTRENIRD